jgi:hypothetical protein
MPAALAGKVGLACTIAIGQLTACIYDLEQEKLQLRLSQPCPSNPRRRRLR